MSYLDKMSIQGIRSFGQEDHHRGLVQFFSPLTLILGPNGTGKTTIIECLKYITTGSFPPGVGRGGGGSFVHDPKVAHESEVKAQVRLQFRDVRDKITVVQRSMMATQKGKKVEFKTLDGMIITRTSTGEKRELNSKCAELDREMVSLLGVSQPVLENVIFCHQEDSNWPLGEGKALKTKFDDIFASTRYVKALEAIRKYRMQQGTEIRELTTEVKYLKQNKEKVQQLRTELEDAEDLYLDARNSIEKITEKQQPIEDQLARIRSNNDNVNRLYGEKEALSEKKREIERNQAEIRQNIKNEFTGSKDELQEAIDDFERQEYEQKQKLSKLEKQVSDLDTELRRYAAEKTRLTNEQGRLEQEAESFKQWTMTRNKLIRKISSEHSLPDDEPVTEASVSRFLENLENIISAKTKERETKGRHYAEKESLKQQEMDTKRKEHTQLETKLRMKAEQYKKNKEEIRIINQELSQVEASQDRLQDISKELQVKKLERADLEKAVDLGKLRSEVKRLEEEKNQFSSKLRNLNSEMSRMSQESEARAQLDVSRKDKSHKLDQIRRLKAKNEDTLTHLLGDVPQTNFRRSLDNYLSQQVRQVRSSTDELQKLRRDLTELETKRSMMKDRLSEKQKELKDLEEKVFSVSESQNFDEGLKRITDKLQQNVNEKGYLKGIVHLYNKFVTTLQREDPGCPLCHRPFDQQSEVTELIEELEEKLNIVPDKLEKCTRSITEYKAKEEKMLQMKPLKAKIVELNTNEIPALVERIRSHSSRIESLSSSVNEKEEELDLQQVDEATAKSIQPDMVLIDRFLNEVESLDVQISHQSSLLSGSETTRTMQDVREELDDVQLQIDSIGQTLSNRQKKMTDHTEQLQKLGENINRLGSEQVQLQQNLQKRIQLEDSKKELNLSNTNLQQDIQKARADIQPLQDEIHQLETEKEELAHEGKKIYEAQSSQITRVRDQQREVNGYQSQIQRYLSEGKDSQLEQSRQGISHLQTKSEQTEDKRKQVNHSVSSIKQDQAAKKTRERELHDNMLLIRKQEQIGVVEEKIEALDKKLGGIDVGHLQRELDVKQKELEKLTREKQTWVLKKERKEEEIRLLKKNLRDDVYRTAESDYTTKVIKLKTTEIANKDLDKYYKALDITIMQYHAKKMSEINKIIRELWRNTYRGNDIETIEIRSDEEEESGAAKKRRSYNYRVVMIKGDTALDMRGRCSAGQKVLASLIIRLALAETFCLHCGFFALDEPTTNLDRENIESLAFALAEIIRSRAVQRNFQLLVITHDEDFVELLGRSDYVDEFFKVSKDDGGYSRLTKARVEDIQR